MDTMKCPNCEYSMTPPRIAGPSFYPTVCPVCGAKAEVGSGKDASQSREGVVGMSQSRRADLILLLMLLLSGLASMGLSVLILEYTGQRPDSFLEGIVWFVGNMGGEYSGTGQESYEEILRQGSFFLSLLILGGVSFLAYFKCLKGQIAQPKVGEQFK